MRHQVKNLFNNLNASLYFPAIGYIVIADSVSKLPTIRLRLETYTHIHTPHSQLMSF